ncbi:MAG: Thiamine pyrophosphate-requiring enzyme [Spirochaetes bacterium]|nr:MAG: Thiamine pyrophosphate-requiring enzyme [Spirochaetota bacterium]
MKREMDAMEARARAIQRNGGVGAAIESGELAQFQAVSLAEALVIGLLNQGVRKYIGVFGHGSTALGEVLSCYEAAGTLRMWNLRNETEAAHCVTMLKWHYGETAAVVTSIGPGALNAFSGSLAAASNGIGVYHIYGDETTHDEGPNMQQIPIAHQGGFLSLANAMGSGYQIHTPEALFTALRLGAATVFNPEFPGPFFLLLPMNVQSARMGDCNLLELPLPPRFSPPVCFDREVFEKATRLARQSKAVTIKFGGGGAECGPELLELADLLDAVIVPGAKMSGVVPYSHPRVMAVGGSKGSLCGNYAMNQADLAIVIGARAVCQWDCSGTAWKKAKAVVNFNTRAVDAGHYNRTVAVIGDAKPNLRQWIDHLKKEGFAPKPLPSPWLEANLAKKSEWQAFKKKRFDNPTLFDPTWGRKVLTQPAAIEIAYRFAAGKKAARYFDAGDVQANGFQIVEDEARGLTFSDTGSSFMGLAASSLLCTAVANNPVYTFAFSGDGSFTMTPQIIFDGVEHGVRGCLLIFDNRSMAAIAGLQMAQYGNAYRTKDSVEIDYKALSGAVRGVKALFGGYDTDSLVQALEEAYAHDGLSVLTVPVYMGDDELGGLGVFGDWNVGAWCDEVQKEHHRIGL